MFGGTGYFAQFCCPVGHHTGTHPSCPYAHGEVALLLAAAIGSVDTLVDSLHQRDAPVRVPSGHVEVSPATTQPMPMQAPMTSVAPSQLRDSRYQASGASAPEHGLGSTVPAHSSLVATLTAMSKRLDSPFLPPPDLPDSASSSSPSADRAPSTPNPAKKPLLLGRRKAGVSSTLRGIGVPSPVPKTTPVPKKIETSSRPPPPQNLAPLPSRALQQAGDASEKLAAEALKPEQAASLRISHAGHQQHLKRKAPSSVQAVASSAEAAKRLCDHPHTNEAQSQERKNSAHQAGVAIPAGTSTPAVINSAQQRQSVLRRGNPNATALPSISAESIRKVQTVREDQTRDAMSIKGDQLKLAVERHKRMMAERHGVAAHTPAASDLAQTTRQAATNPSSVRLMASASTSSSSSTSAVLAAGSSSTPGSARMSSNIPPPAKPVGVLRPSGQQTSRLAKIRREMSSSRPAPVHPKKHQAGVEGQIGGEHSGSIIKQRSLQSSQRLIQNQSTSPTPLADHVQRLGRAVLPASSSHVVSRGDASTAPPSFLPSSQASAVDAGYGDDLEEFEYHELQGKARDIVPAGLYPVVELCSNSKVPRAARQTVLDKFLDQTLRKHHFRQVGLGEEEPHTPQDAWMHAAIEEAVRVEKEQYQKCVSQVGYMNLCAHAMRALQTEMQQDRTSASS